MLLQDSDCGGQAADAVSAYTQVKIEDAARLLKIPSPNVQTDGYVFHDTNGRNPPVVLLERIFFGHPLEGLLWERQFEEVLLELEWEKVPNWECLFLQRKQGLFSTVYVWTTKNRWKEAENGSHVEEIGEKCGCW